MLDNITNFIKLNKDKYIDLLKEINGYPSVCDYSSMIIGAYLSTKFNIEPTYISGEFLLNDDDEEGDIHNWLNINGIIIDFTINQFYPNTEIEPIIMKNSSLYNKYEEFDEYSIPNIYINIANNSSSFGEYLNKIKKKNIESMFK